MEYVTIAPIEPEKPNVSNQKNQQQYKIEVQEFTEKLNPPLWRNNLLFSKKQSNPR